ncbi:subunit of the Nup84p subcomplex of the nuclear pore complex [Pseudozyma hubeiensis SY62]|uniref:Subunit of the Nup84p subcomplex of the nuclear pore complex n=1 Tax=Pseudozyma hubeiensis (strain SY62) TaxID=1305764 RepID=R9P855_PSEHS|nr:subunit of the Nup84p subcomplex of the nuclear pore complex [Pseudozyma hubeiensis SY62]GAC97422.1 subunit of the Nup84p subcomplex of the nuclear pore complex [Pseudozyma hubeiensis SY62]
MSRSTNRPSRAGTPVFGGQDPTSPPSFLSPITFRRGDSAHNNDAGDVSSNSLFLSANARPRATRARPRPSSMLAAAGPNVSLLSPGSAFDREGSVISDDADMRSVAESALSASHAGFGRRPPLPNKDAKAQLEEGTVLLGDQWMHVSAYSKLPVEVLEVLSDADLYIDAFQGHLDVQTGYACLVSRTQCFVWNYSSRGIGTSSPTCFIFPVPQYASSSMTAINDLAHCCFLPRGANREPALLLVAPDGQTCLWEGISSSLTRQDRAQRLSAPLSSAAEIIIQLQRVDESTVVLATSQSRMLRVSIGSRAGVLQAEIRPFSQQRGLLGRLFGSTSAIASSNDPIVSIAVAPLQPGKQGREVYAIGRKTLQKWQVLDQGGERLLAEQDVQQVVASNVLQLSDERYGAAQSLSFDIVSGAVQSDGQLVLLYSQSKTEREPHNYGLAIIDAVKDAGSFVVASILSINYSNFADPRPYALPTLSMPNGGPAAFICFADTVVAKQLETGCETFEEVIKLKDDVKNRFIGSGCDSIDVGNNHAIAALSLISATSGSLLVETSIDEIRNRCTAYASAADRQRADTERLKGKLEQALYYSESLLNPLTFQLPSHLQGTLMTACEDLSRQLLTFSNPISQSVPPSVDLRTALKDRLGKLRFLVKFVAVCGHLEKLPQTTKRQLRADAELAAALSELWVYQNEFYTSAHSHGSATQSPLAKAIETVMAEQGLGTGGDDLVRKFFRHHADLTTKVLARLLSQTKGVSAQPLRSRSTEVLELNRIVLSAFRAALRYRKESVGLYGIVESQGGAGASAAAPMAGFEAWTAQSVSVQLLESLYSLTVNLIPDRTRELGSSIDAASTEFSSAVSEESKREHRAQTELKAQLCSLAEIALACYTERIQYLQASAAAAADIGALERELSVFSTTYRTARPLFIRPLVSIHRSDRAFTLAEQYSDFRTLVELSQEPNLQSDARTETYLERYQQAFAYELYNWYIEHHQQRKLLTQKPEYNQLVLSYLEQPGKERLAWLHDLALKRFDAASSKLEALGLKEGNLAQRKLMLSLGKLGYLSTLGLEQLSTVGVQKQVEFFDDQLDLIAVQDSLAALWENSVMGSLPIDLPRAGTQEAATLASEIVDTVASRLIEYPAYREHYMQLVQQLLLSNRYLSAEDLVDLLTLKDTPETQLEDFATAIKVLIRAGNIPASRREASLKSIWRRSVLRDDWVSLSETNNVSDQTLMDDLKRTALWAMLREVLGDDAEAGRDAWVDVGDLAVEDDVEDAEGDGAGMRGLLEARFADAPDHFVSLLLQDYRKEVATVGGFLEDSDLPRLAHEMAGLAANEGADGQAGEADDSMLVE